MLCTDQIRHRYLFKFFHMVDGFVCILFFFQVKIMHFKNIIDIQFMHKRSKFSFHKVNDVWFGLGIKITCKFDLFYHSNFWVCMCDLWQTKPILKNIDTISLLVGKFTIVIVCSSSQIYGGDFAKFCGLIRIYELYYSPSYPGFSDLPTALLLNCELIDGV